jgi:ATP-binding cassette, subfamily F, member 3
MLTVHNIHKSYGIETILAGVSLTLNPGQRIGLVGPNGSGKTTLLRIIAGLEKPDAGSVRFHPSGLKFGYLPQGAQFTPNETLQAYLQRCEGDLPALSARLEDLAQLLAQQPDQPDLQEKYAEILLQIESAAESSGRGPAVLASLGLDLLPPDLPVSALSGGQKTRLALAGVLLAGPRLLLLDEPTNHLDLDMLAWLEEWLSDFNGGVLVVSHDRTFLDQVATAIIEIDGSTHTARTYAGNYSAYLEEKIADRERQWQAFSDQQQEIQRLRAAASSVRSKARFRKGGKADPENTDGFSAGFFANRSKETVQKAKNIEKRIERLLTEDHIDKPAQTWEMKIEFGHTPSSGWDVVVMENLIVGYGDLLLLRDLNLTLRHASRTALIGPNGSGKTTLLRTIAGQIQPLAGRLRLGSNVRLGYMAQEQENLDPDLDAFTTLQKIAGLPETEARAFLSRFLFKGDDVFIPAGKLSYGERARLTLASLTAQGCNLLLLDEPINHLDIPARTRFEQALVNFKGAILAVVHDRYFLDSFARELWEVQADTIRRVDLTVSA